MTGKTVYIKSVVPYSRYSRVARNIKTECTLDQKLVDFIIQNSAASGVNIVAKDNIKAGNCATRPSPIVNNR